MDISKSSFELMLGTMKAQLKLAEFKFGGRDSESFRYFKEQTMNHFYEGIRKFFQQGLTDGTFEKCSCGANMRHGWTECPRCSGSGYSDTKKVGDK
jgi:hypothetical protein